MADFAQVVIGAGTLGMAVSLDNLPLLSDTGAHQTAWMVSQSGSLLGNLHVRLVQWLLNRIPEPRRIEAGLARGLDLDDNFFAVGPIRQIRDCGKGAEHLISFGFEPVSDLCGLERQRGSGSGPWSRTSSGAGLLGLGTLPCGTFFWT